MDLRHSAVFPLLGYSVFAILWIGRGVVLHPESRVLGDKYPDKTIVMWSFLWWPQQLAHGHDPFLARVVWAPYGVDLSWVTSMPGASVLLAPFSETLGPVFAYNLAALAAPPLAAWAAFLLARRLTANSSAALVAGFLFGFSPYMAGQSSSHLNLSLVFLVPLLGYLAVTFVQGGLGRWLYATFFGLALAAQFYFSTEVFATFTLMAAISFLITWLVLRELRGRLGALAVYSGVAYIATGVLAVPYLLHAFLGGTAPPARGVIPASEDLANLVVPTRTTWLQLPGSHSIAQHFSSNGAEQGAYLGFLLLGVFVLATVELRGRRRRGVWVLLLSALASTLLALGPRIRADGHKIADGAWILVGRLPAIQSALPIRFDMYTTLFSALVVALWLAQGTQHRGWRYGLAILAVAIMLPTPNSSHWASKVPQSSFFTTPAYRRYLRSGETALVLPYGPTGWSMLWQAESGFRFSMIGGWVGRSILRPDCRSYWEYRDLVGVRPADNGSAFRRFVISHHVRVVVEAPGTQPFARRLIRTVFPDVRPIRVADATLFQLPPNLPAALPKNSPPLTPSTLPQNPPSDLPCAVPTYANS